MRKGIWIVAALLAMALPAQAAEVSKAKAVAKVDEANAVISEIMATPDKSIPEDLFGKVSAIAIFPGVIKAGFVVGGKYGRGVILHYDRKAHRWSPPAFYSIGAGSVGWQIGAQSTDLILLIRHERGLKALLDNEVTLGADASVAAGPVGRDASAGVDASMKTEIWSYSRSRGLFAGLSLEGAKINVLKDYNKAYYGKSVKPFDILYAGKVGVPKSARNLAATLKKHSK
jgi:lipid-binding SYLF domain-containing protein